MKNTPKNRRSAGASGRDSEAELRIIGGKLRGRKLVHEKRAGTRPMKHRVREAIFNLVGIECKGRHAIDLFAGTGAIGLEALSRGADSATFIERHVPTARTIAENIQQLEVASRTELLTTSAFLWAKRDLPECAAGRPSRAATDAKTGRDGQGWIGAGRTWIVFCSPPFDFYVSQFDEMARLIGQVLQMAPRGSTLVVEADGNLDFDRLPFRWGAPHGRSTNDADDATWDVRTYAPAVVGVLRDSRPIELT